jgi:ADP-ribose pyrophosphatase
MNQKTEGQTIIHVNPRFRVARSGVSNSGTGLEEDFFYVVKPDAVCVIPVCGDTIGMILVDRPIVNENMWELPGGRMTEGESPVESGMRELKEETGLEGRDWKELGSFYPLPGIVSEKIHMVSCIVQSGVNPEICKKERIIEMKFFTADEIRGMIKENMVKSSRDGYVLLRCLGDGSLLGRDGTATRNQKPE